VALPAGDSVPDEFSYLIAEAKDRYRSAGKSVPASWTMGDVFNAWPTGRADFQAAIEDHYRTYFTGLKSCVTYPAARLDLRGGMYVVIQADFAALEESLRNAMTEEERKNYTRSPTPTARIT